MTEITIPSIEEMVKLSELGKVKEDKKRQEKEEKDFIEYKKTIFDSIKAHAGEGKKECRGWHHFGQKDCKFAAILKKSLTDAGYEISPSENDPMVFKISWENRKVEDTKSKKVEKDNFPHANESTVVANLYNSKINVLNETDYETYKNDCINTIKEASKFGQYQVQWHDHLLLLDGSLSIYAKKLVEGLKSKGYKVTKELLIMWHPEIVITGTQNMVHGGPSNTVFGGPTLIVK